MQHAPSDACASLPRGLALAFGAVLWWDAMPKVVPISAMSQHGCLCCGWCSVCRFPLRSRYEPPAWTSMRHPSTEMCMCSDTAVLL